MEFPGEYERGICCSFAKTRPLNGLMVVSVSARKNRQKQIIKCLKAALTKTSLPCEVPCISGSVGL